MSPGLRDWEKKIFAFSRFNDLTLDRMGSILKKLGNPERKIPPIIHVAGTNGKGSTIAFLKTILREAGYKVHVYTSPHLIRLNERFIFANEEVKDQELELLFEEVFNAKGKIDCTWFEFLTLAAFLGFSRHHADFSIIETGLGGTFDATNSVPAPLLALITSISLDHQDRLGKTLFEIAQQKAGIIKENSFALIGKNKEKILDYFKDYLSEKKIPGKYYHQDWLIKPVGKGFQYCSELFSIEVPKLGLLGQHQYENASLAIAAVLKLREKGYIIGDEHIQEGLKTTTWSGRLQKLQTNLYNEIWVDGAHNEGGMKVLLACLDEMSSSCAVVLSIARSKDPQNLLKAFQAKKHKLFVYANKDNYFHEAKKIKEIGKTLGLPISEVKSMDSFLDQQKGMIVFCGSLHFVGFMQRKLEGLS